MAVELVSGAAVVFVAGKYKNKQGYTTTTGKVDRLTPRKVWITLDGSGGEKRVCVNQTSVSVIYCSTEDDAHPPLVGMRRAVSPSPPSSVASDYDKAHVVVVGGGGGGTGGRLVVSTDRFIDAVSKEDDLFEDALTRDDDLVDEPDRFEDAMSVQEATVPTCVVVTDDEASVKDAVAETMSMIPPTSRVRPSTGNAMLHTINGWQVDSMHLLFPGQKTDRHRTFAHHCFGNSILPLEFVVTSVPSGVVLPTSFLDQGRTYQLLLTKLHLSKVPHDGVYRPRTIRASAHYIATTCLGAADSFDLEHELNKIANFAAMSSPQKAASRLELFASTACKRNQQRGQDSLIFDLSVSDFEEIGTSGECGFIPKSLIKRFLGKHAVGKRTHALQIRLFAPRLGIFKGVLMEKPGISKIQLTGGMRKVGPSLLVDTGNDWASLVVRFCHPSDTNVQVEKILQGVKKLPKCFVPKRLSSMVTRLWEGLGVSQETIEGYTAGISKDKRNLQHAFVVGVADPTESLPEGHVFVTGLSKNGVSSCHGQLFVTRCPCMEPNDGLLLPVVTTKPHGMSNEHWSWLHSLEFGSIVFAATCSSKGHRPLPELIANGDLDGDLYFTCWNSDILSAMQSASQEIPNVHQLLISDDPRLGPSAAASTCASTTTSTTTTGTTTGTGWLWKAQKCAADVRSMVALSKLIGKLYSRSLEAATKSPEGICTVDAIHLGRAYKQALDLEKHGGTVPLPRALWDQIPEDLHVYLETI